MIVTVLSTLSISIRDTPLAEQDITGTANVILSVPSVPEYPPFVQEMEDMRERKRRKGTRPYRSYSAVPRPPCHEKVRVDVALVG